jgi:hypothetical protein
MTALGNKKRFVMQWPIAVMLALLFFSGPVLSQCDPDQNAYLYLHPAFAGKNWAQTAYDSILVYPSDSLCGLKPALFDICGVPDSAVGVFLGRDRNMYMVKTAYTCDGGCMPCMLEYPDPLRISLSGMSLSPVTPLYLPKDPARYGNALVMVLFATIQKQVLALSVFVSNQSITKRDTLTLSALSAGQDIIGIKGDYDTVTKKDIGVWVVGTQGLIRYFPLANNVWGNETKRDLAIQDTVFCVGNGFAGTSTGTLYRRNAGGAFVLDSKPVSAAITNIYAKGAVGKNGTVLQYSGGVWTNRQFGTGDYRYGNFTNRWDGAAVELLDSTWAKTGYTYHDFPSTIASTQPFPYVNNMTYVYTSGLNQAVTITMTDPDSSFIDFRIDLVSYGTIVSLKNDGKYTILNIPGNTLCPRDSIRLKSGTIACGLTNNNVSVSAGCMRGQYMPLCQSYSWTDYQFVTTHSWRRGDTVVVTTGSNRLRIANNASAVTALDHNTSLPGAGSIVPRQTGATLTFAIRQGIARKVIRIALYNVKGRLLASMPVDGRSSVTAPLMGNSLGIVYARYVFSDGSSSGQNILLLR